MEWIDVRFSDFLKERKGKYKPNDERIKDLKRIEKIDFSGQIYLSNKPSKTNMILVKDGDLVISGINVEKGAMNIFHGEEDVIATIHYSSYTYNTDIIDLEFLKHFLKSKKFKDVLKEQVPGGIKTEIKPKHLLPLEIQIPKSLNEQRRVVYHLDSLYDSLDKVSTKITSQLSLIKNLRQAFLREAMQGVLVSNETSDNKTGADLLAEIQAEKAQLIKEKKIKKGKLTKQSKTIIDLNLPSNWSLCKFDDLFFVTKLAGFEYTDHMNLLESGDIPVIRAQNVRNINIDKTNLLYIDKETSLKLERCALTKKCILITFIGAGIGDVATFNEKARWHLAPNVAKAEPFIGIEYLYNVKYFNYFLISSFGKIEIQKHMKATAQPSLSMETIRDIDIPLPPLEIQEHIVAKLDKLMGYCDALEEQVKQSQKTNELLLQQVLREVLDGKPEEESIEEEIENYQSLVIDVFGTASKVQSINNSDLEDAALVYLMKNNLGYSYGEVALQKAKYNSSFITPNLYSKQYDFRNYHFGTYSEELRGDLQSNPYLIQKKERGKEVFAINPSREKEILDIISNKENKDFVTAINELLQIYSLPFIGKKTDMMELFNTVLKIYADLRITNIDIIYQAMKDWKVKQTGFKTKAEKFTKEDTEKMIKLLQSRNIIK